MNTQPPYYQHVHHPYNPSQQHQDHLNYGPPPMNHHHSVPPSSVYHYSSNHLYGINSGYPPQNSGFGYPHLHSYSSTHHHPSPYPPQISESTHYYEIHNGSSGYLPPSLPPPARIQEDKPYITNNQYPPRFSAGKEYGRITNKPIFHNNNNIKKVNSEQMKNKPSEKSEPTLATKDIIFNDKNNQIQADNNKRKINVDIQPNKRQKQTVQTTNDVAVEKSNEIIVNNSNNEENSSNNLEVRVLRVCTEKSSVQMSEQEIFKYFPNALKVRKENQRDFLVEFYSLIDMIPYIEAETKEEECLNISIPKSLIPTEYLNDTKRLVLEFVEFLKQKQPQTLSDNTNCDSASWEKLVSSIKIPQNVSPYDLLEFRERRVKKTLGKVEFGILIHEKPRITDKPGFPIVPNPKQKTTTKESFYFFAFCKTGTALLSKEEVSKCFPNAKSIHFTPGSPRIIIEMNSENDFNAYKKISHSGKLIVRNHTFLLRKGTIKDIPPEVLNPPSITPPSSPPKTANPDRAALLQQLRKQMDHIPEPPKPESSLHMKNQPPTNTTLKHSKSDQSLDLNFISLSEPESELSEDDPEEESDTQSYTSESIEEAPSSPLQPQTPKQDKTLLLSALREQMQSAEKKKEPITTTPTTTAKNTKPSVSASSTNTLGIKRKTFANHYALFHGKFHK